jgi:site-specific DNA-cytosine methylase
MSFKVLTINTYGGSLLLAAKLAGLPVVASLEDAGFGSDLQALNFPEVPLFKTWREWPKGRMDGIIVLAHPPCAAFSNQNQNYTARGVAANSFKCHTDVMEYSLGNGCEALAIESVVGAYKVARPVYEEFAQKYGYNCYFILQNAAAFGVPQWRPRFWVLFTKTESLSIKLPTAKLRVIVDILNPKACAATDPGTSTKRTRSRPGLALALSEAEESWTGPLLNILEKKYELPRTKNFMNVREKFGLTGLFTTGLPRFVDPYDLATTVLEDSWWWIGKRELTVEEYCCIMGFPPDYKWGNQKNNFRKYLSKGVCPPVAAWVLNTLNDNLLNQNQSPLRLSPGQTCDLAINREKLLRGVEPWQIS